MGSTTVLVLLGALASAPADGALELRWEAPPECPTVEVLAARTRARVDASVPARAIARVRAVERRYHLELEITGPSLSPLRRELDAPRCDELVEATALVIAVAIDPVFVVDTPQLADAIARTEAPPRIARPRATPRTAAPVVTATRTRPRFDTLGIALRPSAGVWFGALPRVAAAIGFDLVVPARRSLRAELGMLAIPRQRVDVAPGAGARLWLATAIARACFAPAVGRVRPLGCAGIAVGAIGGRGEGDAVQSSPGAQPWVSATAAAGLTIALVRRLELFARGEGHLHLRLPRFHLDAIGPVHEVGAASVTGLAGLQLVLP